MTRVLLVLWNADMRRRAHQAIDAAPNETRVEVKGPKRTLPQNNRMWAMLTDVSRQIEHCGRFYPPETWKSIFLHALGREVEFVPSLDSHEIIPLGLSSSELEIPEMADLIEFMFAEGAKLGVEWSEPKDRFRALAPREAAE
ncbi:recombination protein NinB [Rhodoblastus sp.]|uniref:recombination protein NinB n=1 Tax=Rhodoblastus sp. TaxID=1962975 RepID=UPI003F95A66C